MKLTINGVERQLDFGIRFIRDLDSIYYQDEDVKFATGIEMAYVKLPMHDLTMLKDVLTAALAKSIKFNDDDFDTFFASNTEAEINSLCDELAKNLERQPMTATRIKKFKANLKKADKEAVKD